MRTSRWVAAVVAGALVVAACGDDARGDQAVAEDGDQPLSQEVSGPELTAGSTGDDPPATAAGDTDRPAAETRDDTDSEDRDTEDPDSEDIGSEDIGSEDTVDSAAEDEEPRTRDTGPTTVQPVFLFPAAEGDSGDDVKALQARLASLGFAPGTPDGSYGRKTSRAVAAFQRLVGLEETGNADDLTVDALRNYHYDGLILLAGDEGPEVEALQERLAAGPFDPGSIDGQYGTTTVQAVWALEKLAGMPVDGNWGPLDEKAWQLLEDGEIGGPTESHDVRWVEVDLSEQLVKVYDPGETTPTLISHASSGSGIPWSNEEFSGSSVTPLGDFEINRRISGWRESSLNIGRLYNPLYFNGGIAFHGATSVPLYPASHGCIRLPMHVAEYLPDVLPNGTAVHVDA